MLRRVKFFLRNGVAFYEMESYFSLHIVYCFILKSVTRASAHTSPLISPHSLFIQFHPMQENVTEPIAELQGQLLRFHKFVLAWYKHYFRCDWFMAVFPHLYGELLFTWLSLVMSMMVSFCAVLFPTRCLGWDLELNWVSFWGFSFLLFHNYIESEHLQRFLFSTKARQLNGSQRQK